jgi:holin-like protein
MMSASQHGTTGGSLSAASGVRCLLPFGLSGRARALAVVRTELRPGLTGAATVVRLGCQVALLWVVFAVSTLAVSRLQLPVPGNIVGMLLLFTLLSTGIVKERWIAGAANVLTKHLAFFFIPIAVGLMDWGGLLWQAGHWMLLAIAVSSVVGMLASGVVIQLVRPVTAAEAK